MDSCVSSLINEDNQWDVNKIYSHFDNMDADKIISIPLPRQPKKDQLCWHYEKRGQYSVKSGYQVALRLKFPAIPSSSGSTNSQWKIIWTLEIPEKMRIFIWRAAKNLLPSAENLWKRKIVQDPSCQTCRAGVENIFHALVTCKRALKVWKLTQFAEEMKRSNDQDIISLLQGRMNARRKADAEMLVAVWWGIWNARNQQLFKNKKEDPQIVLAKAEAIVHAYKRTQIPAYTDKDIQGKVMQQSWKPPPIGCFKLNVDAATKLDKQISGFGAVVRDAAGNVIAAAIKVSAVFGDVAQVEAEAMEWGLQVAGGAGLSRLIVETDSQEVANFVNKQSNMKEIEWIVSEIQNLRKGFNQIKIQYIPSSCNCSLSN